MGGKINLFVDCNSPYSYFALLHLIKHKALLKEHGVEIEYWPFFLGGIMQGSGNSPPWKVPAKAQMNNFEVPRAKKFFGAPNVHAPPFFPIMSLLPMRSMVYVKESFPTEKLEAALRELWVGLWEQEKDVSKPEVLTEILQRNFTADEAKAIIEAGTSAQYKQGLSANTEKALKQGAFGAPWFWVVNDQGKEEPFFGSDRWHYMWDFLNVPYTNVTIKAKAAL